MNPPSSAALDTWAGRELNPQRAAAIKKHSGGSFLDVGCGNGRYVSHFSTSHTTFGVDAHAYDEWGDLPEQFKVADARSLPFDDNSFDTVVSFEMLEHMDDPATVLREFRRVCSKNIILSVPNCRLLPGMEKSRLTYYHYTDETHCNFYDLDSLRRLVEAQGFRVVEKRLINPVNLAPLLNEAFVGPAVLWRKMLQYFGRNQYYMTCLLIAAKPDAAAVHAE